MIASTVNGRIRVRSNRLKSRKTANSIQQEIENLEGVYDVRTNTGAGSIIVNFDPRVIEPEHLEELIENAWAPTPNGNRKKGKTLSRTVNRVAKVGMMSTLATSITYGFLGNKKQHIRYGKAFLAFAGVHMLKHSNRLLR